MCGRFASFQPPQVIQTRFCTVNPLVNVSPSWNVAPSHEVMVVRHNAEANERRLDMLRWGFVPHWTKSLTGVKRPINARAETVATSAMFARAFARRRCLIPADAWYEWQAHGKEKTPYALGRRDHDMMAFGGVWETWTAPAGTLLRTFAIITCAATGPAAVIHDRMPVIVGREDWPLWLGEENGDAAPLLRAAPADVLEAWPVDPAVGKVANNYPELLAAVG